MNCLEYRREKLADPRRVSTEAQLHGAACDACRRFGASVDEQEARLAQALLIPVPEGLAERSLLRARTLAPFPVRLLAVAASVVVTLGAGIRWWYEGDGRDAAQLAIGHVTHEPESFTGARGADPERVRAVLHAFGAELQAPLGRVRYMKLCPVAGGTAWHIVFETDAGLATLLLVPSKRLARETREAGVAGWTALARPAGAGYYAIVTDSPESLRRVDQLLTDRVLWRG